MQPKEFLYFLTDESGNSYSVNENDVVELGATPTPLPNSPDGWQDKTVEYARNPKYLGFFRSFSVPLKFVRDGARILRELVYTGFIEPVTRLVILRLNKDTYVHETFYDGELDKANFADNENYVECNAIDGGPSKYLKSSENTTYEIDVSNHPEAIDVIMDGIELLESGVFSIVGEDVNYAFYVPSFVFINKEGQSTGVEMESQTQEPISGSVSAYYQNSENYCFVSEKPITIRIAGSISFKVTQNTVNGKLRLYFRTSLGNQYDIYYNPSQPNPASPAIITFPVNITINLAAGEKMFLGAVHYGIVTGSTPYFKVSFIDTSRLSMGFVTKYKTTKIKALRPMTLLSEIVKKMTDGRWTVKSDLFNADGTVVATSGDALRGFDDARIKTSLAEFVQSYNLPYCIGLGFEQNRFVVEPKAYFFDKSAQIADLGEVSELKIEIAKDLLHNRLKVGWPNQNYEDVNGRAEFNTTQSYTFPITRVNKEFDLVSKYRADMYGIEYTRINFEGKVSTDSQSDNDAFLIKIQKDAQPDGSYALDRSLNTGATGLPSHATAFNLALSPKRCLLANAAHVASFFDQTGTGAVNFQTSDKNRDLVSDYNGVLRREGEDMSMAEFQQQIFKPYVASFNCPVPYSLVDLMATTPNGYFGFTWNNRKLKGFLLDGGISPATEKSQDIKVLICPDIDMKNLIN